MNSDIRKCTFQHVCPVKIQISLHIRAVWSESSPGLFGINMDAKFLHSDKSDSGQTARTHRLVWVFFGWISEGMFSGIAAQMMRIKFSEFSYIKNVDNYLSASFVHAWVKYCYTLSATILFFNFWTTPINCLLVCPKPCWMIGKQCRSWSDAIFSQGLVIAPGKREYQENIFLISPRKHTLWVLIRSA